MILRKKILILTFVLILIQTANVGAESALGPPIGTNVVVVPDIAEPGQEVNVRIEWWITNDSYKYYQGPFNLHIGLNDTDGNSVEDWDVHVCNYCCGNCPINDSSCNCYLNCSCSCASADCGEYSAQCQCSTDCCSCLDTNGNDNVSDDFSCCGYQASEDNPYVYEFNKTAPQTPGDYNLTVQIVTSCLTEIKGNSEHNLLVASQGGSFTTVPEFPTIAIPILAVIGLMFLLRRR
ncbi:hypothetical protein DRO97_09685 [Archaeoglobales archaeon]|nr:MAG: hypothetical protein DRO97_09685 [Archaeoglobales archaeon]